MHNLDRMFEQFMKDNKEYIDNYTTGPLTYRQRMYESILINMFEYHYGQWYMY